MSVLAITLTALALLAYPMLSGKMYIFADLEDYHLPLRSFYKQCLTQGHAFTWMPSILCGYYVHAEGQVGMYHPLHFLMYRSLPLDWAFNAEFFLSYPLMLWGMFLFLRRWKLPRHAALFGGFSFAFSGFCLLHGVHVNAIEIAAHIPWLLLAIDIVMRPATSNRTHLSAAALGVALLTASQLLLGYPQYVYLSCLVEALYALFLAYLAWKEPAFPGFAVRRLGLLAGAKALAVLLGAVQLLPTFDMLAYSRRVAPALEFRYFFSLHPGNLVQFIGPYFFQGYVGMNQEAKQPHEMGLYTGAIATVLLVWAVMRHVRPGRVHPHGIQPGQSGVYSRRALAMGALGLAGLALVLALGKYGLLYRLVAHLPLVKSFRGSCRHIVLVHLGMAVLSAIALADLTKAVADRAPVPWRRLWPLALPVLAGCAVAAIIVGTRMGLPGMFVPLSIGPFLTSNKEVLISPILMGFAACLVVLAARGWRAAPIAIVLFAAMDQTVYGMRYLYEEPPVDLDTFVSSIDTPPPLNGNRVHALLNNHLLMKGVDNSHGYIAIGLERHLPYHYGQENVLRLAGVRWASNSWPVRGARIEWTEVPDPLPIARLVTRAIVSHNPADDIERVDLGTTALVSEPIDIPEGVPGQATIAAREPGRIRIRTQSASRQLLAVSESFHPGWNATVDGTEQRVIRVYGDFMGCVVEAGAHEVVLRFQPASLRIGKRLSCLGMLLAVAGFLLLRR